MDRTALRARVAANLRARIDARGLTVRAAAELAGLSREYLQRVLAEQQSISLERFVALCEALDADPGAMLREQPVRAVAARKRPKKRSKKPPGR